MDDNRFDDLTRVLARRGSRRGFIGVLGGAAVALAGRGVAEAACGPDQIERNGSCLCKTTGRPPGSDGFCPCPNGTTRCDGACVETCRNLGHCGACGNACPEAPPCQKAV